MYLNDNIEKENCQEKKGKKEHIVPMKFYDKKDFIDPMSPIDPSEKKSEMSREQFIVRVRKTLVEDNCKQENTPATIPESHNQNTGKYSVSLSNVTSTGAIDRCLPNNPVSATITANKVDSGNSITLLGSQSKKAKKPTALDLAKKVKRSCTLCVKDSSVYLYINGYYNKMEQDDMEGVIWDICRSEVDQVGSKSIISGAYQLLMIDSELKTQNLESAKNIVPFQNCLIRLDNGCWEHHSPKFFVTFTLNCNLQYNYAQAECPIFDKYLEDVSGGDTILIYRIWQFIGSCLTQDVNIKAIFVLQGVTNSGKSVLANILRALFPETVITGLDVHSMGEQFAIGDCNGKMICISSDMRAEALNTGSVSNLKKLSGRDMISSAVKYKGRMNFQFTGKVVMVTNHPLILKESDEAFWERIVAIPFRYQIPAESRIHNLEDMLMKELPVIATKALSVYFQLRKDNYRFAGDYEINSLDMYPNSYNEADAETLIFLYIHKYYEAQSDGIVIMEEACNDFIAVSGTPIKLNTFSSLFSKRARELFGAERTRSRDGGYDNAKSALKGIKRKLI